MENLPRKTQAVKTCQTVTLALKKAIKLNRYIYIYRLWFKKFFTSRTASENVKVNTMDRSMDVNKYDGCKYDR